MKVNPSAHINTKRTEKVKIPKLIFINLLQPSK